MTNLSENYSVIRCDSCLKTKKYKTELGSYWSDMEGQSSEFAILILGSKEYSEIEADICFECLAKYLPSTFWDTIGALMESEWDGIPEHISSLFDSSVEANLENSGD